MLLLKGQNESLADDGADLLRVQVLTLPGDAQDDEKMLIVGLNLRSLMGVEDILEGQLVHAETLAQLANQLHITQPLDINPGDRMTLQKRLDLLDAVDLHIFHPLRAVGEKRDSRRSRLFRGHEQAGLRPWGVTHADARDSSLDLLCHV